MCHRKATDWLCGDWGEGEIVKLTLLVCVRCCSGSCWPVSPGQGWTPDQHDCLSNHTSWHTEWSLNHRVVWECSLGTGRVVAICCLGCLRTRPGRPHLSWKCLQKPRQADKIPALECSFFRNQKVALRVLWSQTCWRPRAGCRTGPGGEGQGRVTAEVMGWAPCARKDFLFKAKQTLWETVLSWLNLSECHSNLKKVYVHFLPHLRCPSAYRSRQIKINFALKKPRCIFLTLDVCSFAWDTFFHNESS